ncbi:MAG: serine/threonine protein kinase, partial [Planctomycetes bacterium]|nr:serine/threonine protein kinase [Planctomycetota bacterium]
MKFGRYQLQGRLGEGAAGAVYRAFDEALGRDVALKVLHKVDEVKAKRFEREAEVTARLDHPGVLKVHSFGVEGRVPFLVCELIESARTLAEVFQTAPLLERLDLIRQAAEAVGYAHEQGLVHRDLKPSNLLIDVAGRLRVADFGVATGENMERLTATGAWVGTPLYMSPEQLYSERDKIGPPSDVWALGALLFEALTDRLPFEAESPMELLSAARKPVRSPRTLAPELPREIERICLRALRLDPGERYPTGASFAAALTTYLAGDAQPARVPRGLLAILVGLASLAVVLAA